MSDHFKYPDYECMVTSDQLEDNYFLLVGQYMHPSTWNQPEPRLTKAELYHRHELLTSNINKWPESDRTPRDYSGGEREL